MSMYSDFFCPDPEDFEDESDVVCKHCGQSCYWWKHEKENRWILINIDDDKQHTCPLPSMDELERKTKA